MGKNLEYCDFFDLFLELPGKAWTGLLHIDTTLDIDKKGEDAKGKGGAEGGQWKSIKNRRKPYLSAGGLTLVADPATMGDHDKMVASLIEQLNSLCVRPGTIFEMPDIAQVVPLLRDFDDE